MRCSAHALQALPSDPNPPGEPSATGQSTAGSQPGRQSATGADAAERSTGQSEAAGQRSRQQGNSAEQPGAVDGGAVPAEPEVPNAPEQVAEGGQPGRQSDTSAGAKGHPSRQPQAAATPSKQQGSGSEQLGSADDAARPLEPEPNAPEQPSAPEQGAAGSQPGRHSDAGAGRRITRQSKAQARAASLTQRSQRVAATVRKEATKTPRLLTRAHLGRPGQPGRALRASTLVPALLPSSPPSSPRLQPSAAGSSALIRRCQRGPVTMMRMPPTWMGP